MLGSFTDENAILSFSDDSDGGTARIELIDGGRLLATLHSLTTLTIGSLEGNGAFTQSPGKTAIGSNNLSTTFAGVISSAASSGPIIKIGSGRLTLIGANTYNGGTIVNQGTLLVDNTSGSGTGTAEVVNAGTLGVLEAMGPSRALSLSGRETGRLVSRPELKEKTTLDCSPFKAP